MKKILLIALIFIGAFNASAQRFAYVDTDYILKKLPAYSEAQKKLDATAATWKEEIDLKFQNVAKLYEKFQQEKFLLTEEMKTKREAEANKLQKDRFGFEGELYKKRKELVQPIQDKVFDAIQKLATTRGYDFIFDKSSGGSSMLYSNPTYDLSDQILKNLGIN